MLAAAAVTAVATLMAGGTAGATSGKERPAQGAQATPKVTLKGIGPLRLGMSRGAALRTGWLAERATGCELGGRPYPITYKLTGPKAPAGIRAVAQFHRNKLQTIAFDGGVRTAHGVVVGKTTARGMANRYRAAGFTVKVRYESIFRGTFVMVSRGNRDLIGGYARGRLSARRPVSTLALPYVPTCE